MTTQHTTAMIEAALKRIVQQAEWLVRFDPEPLHIKQHQRPVDTEAADAAAAATARLLRTEQHAKQIIDWQACLDKGMVPQRPLGVNDGAKDSCIEHVVRRWILGNDLCSKAETEARGIANGDIPNTATTALERHMLLGRKGAFEAERYASILKASHEYRRVVYSEV